MKTFDLRRKSFSMNIPISRIRSNDVAEDQLYLDSYISYLKGEIFAILTRTRISDIQCTENWIVLRSDGPKRQNITEAYVENQIAHIQNGGRPQLHLFHHPNRNSGQSFSCPDDRHTFLAYKRLGFELVPCQVLGKPQEELLPEPRILVRLGPDDSVAEHVFQNNNATRYWSILGDESGTRAEVDQKIGELESILQRHSKVLKTLIDTRQKSRGTDYFQSVFSAGCRILEATKAIRLLISNHLERQAQLPLRAAYEAYLRHYCDWLSPENMGPLLQKSTVLKRTKGHRRYNEVKKIANEKFGTLLFDLNIIGKLSDLSPLGKAMHEALYSKLSNFSHQDFEVGMDYIYAEHGMSPAPPQDSEIAFMTRVLDLIVASFVRTLNAEGISDKVEG